MSMIESGIFLIDRELQKVGGGNSLTGVHILAFQIGGMIELVRDWKVTDEQTAIKRLHAVIDYLDKDIVMDKEEVTICAEKVVLFRLGALYDMHGDSTNIDNFTDVITTVKNNIETHKSIEYIMSDIVRRVSSEKD